MNHTRSPSPHLRWLALLVAHVSAYYLCALLLIVEQGIRPPVVLATAWMGAAPLLGRITLPGYWHSVFRVAEVGIGLGLAVLAGASACLLGVFAFLLLAGGLSMHGPKAAGEWMAGMAMTASLMLWLPAPSLIASWQVSMAGLLVVLLFSLLISTLSYWRVNQLREARRALAQQARQQESLSGQLACYLPAAIHQAIFNLKNPEALLSHPKRAWLSVCFADLMGFTELTELCDSEDVVVMLNDFYVSMAEAAQAHGGTLDKFMGDGVLVFFGDARNDDMREKNAQACLHMALDMQQRFMRLRHGWLARGLSRQIGLRVGIGSGWCTLGNFGPRSQMAYTIIGGPVNGASRLQAAAEPDQILLCRATWSSLESMAAQCYQQGRIPAKGFEQGIEAFAYHGAGRASRPMTLETDGFRLLLDPALADQQTTRKLLLQAMASLTPAHSPGPAPEESATGAGPPDDAEAGKQHKPSLMR